MGRLVSGRFGVQIPASALLWPSPAAGRRAGAAAPVANPVKKRWPGKREDLRTRGSLTGHDKCRRRYTLMLLRAQFSRSRASLRIGAAWICLALLPPSTAVRSVPPTSPTARASSVAMGLPVGLRGVFSGASIRGLSAHTSCRRSTGSWRSDALLALSRCGCESATKAWAASRSPSASSP
jgi:hypothetical protein